MLREAEIVCSLPIAALNSFPYDAINKFGCLGSSQQYHLARHTWHVLSMLLNRDGTSTFPDLISSCLWQGASSSAHSVSSTCLSFTPAGSRFCIMWPRLALFNFASSSCERRRAFCPILCSRLYERILVHCSKLSIQIRLLRRLRFESEYHSSEA